MDTYIQVHIGHNTSNAHQTVANKRLALWSLSTFITTDLDPPLPVHEVRTTSRRIYYTRRRIDSMEEFLHNNTLLRRRRRLHHA